MFAFEETSHATAATGIIKSLSFNEEEILTTQNTVKYVVKKIQFCKLIELRIDRANMVLGIGTPHPSAA